MGKKLAILLILSLVLVLASPLSVLAAEDQGQILRIGLAYGSDALAAVHLRSKVGVGYSLGYYDDQRQFVPLAWTGEGKISVLITQNLYLDDQGGYTYAAGDRGAVGCYHVHLPWTYEDFSTAQAAADLVPDAFVAWIKGAYYVRVGSYTSRSEAEAAAAALGVEGACLGETSGYGYCAVAAGTDRILFQFDADQRGETGAFGVLPMANDGEKAVTVLNEGRSYYGGFRFERIGGGASTVVNMVELEDYIKGVIPYEMSASWPLEALKAQAVCARTYSAASARHGSDHFDICTTTHCQVYKGTSGAGAVSDQAVDETAGQRIYYNGKCINGNAVYYSSNGGASEDVKNVWGTDHDYLKGKLDPYEADVADIAGNYRWSKTYTASELAARINARGYSCGTIADVELTYSDLGNAIKMKVTDTAGTSNTFSGDKIRNILGTNSIRFTMTTDRRTSPGQAPGGYDIAGASPASSLAGLYALNGDGQVAALAEESYIVTDQGTKRLEPTTQDTTSGGGEISYTFTGTGWGHSVGMSQWGANAMAKRGYTYLDILKFYYTDITVE